MPTGKSASLVDIDWLLEHQDDPRIRFLEFDWNGVDDYNQGHLPHAVGCNWKEWLWDPLTRDFPTPEDFAQRMGRLGIDNGTTVVVYGSPVQFGTYAWWVMKYCGHEDVRVLDGGRKAWSARHGELTKEIPAIEARSYTPHTGVRAFMRAGRDEVLKAIHNSGTAILDHRSDEEYRGELLSPPGSPNTGAERLGRIPGAVHLHYQAFLRDDDTFRSGDEIRELLHERVGDASRPLLSYCRLSHRATLAYFAVTEIAGLQNLRVYDGSWTEWGSMVGMPVER